MLDDDEVLQLARWASAIEEHYAQPMDMEWAKDGESGKLYIVQARPETVQSRKEAGTLKSYRLKEEGQRLVTGLSVGDSIATGKVCRLESPAQIDRFKEGGVLVTGMTDPDWVPIMKKPPPSSPTTAGVPATRPLLVANWVSPPLSARKARPVN